MSKAPEAGAPAPAPGDADREKARQWFKRAATLRDQRNYDYAIESILSGLAFWPDAVEEGHMLLSAIALQRQQAGGGKPGMFETMKTRLTGKDPKECMLAAERFYAKDPSNATYLDAILQNAARAGFENTVHWIAPKVFESIRREKKVNVSRFRAYKQALVEVGERADALGDAAGAARAYESAVQGLEFMMGLNPGDMVLKDEHRDLAGRLTIVKGKYTEAGDFRESLQDAAYQKKIYDADRVKAADSTVLSVVASAKKDYEAAPQVPGKVFAYVDALVKSEKKRDELEAIDVLERSYAQTQNYSFKVRADDIRLRQLARAAREMRERAKQTGSEDDAQQARFAEIEERSVERDVFTERVRQYPTDLRMKYRLGAVLFALGEYDEAIPQLQQAQGDPRSRSLCQLLIGQSFLEKNAPEDAVDVLKEAVEAHDPPGDETWKKLVYWQARACETAGRAEDASAAYSKLLRVDYGYADGDARKRSEALKQRSKGTG